MFTLCVFSVYHSDQYEYDLVLNTDLYTEKHTQWLVDGTSVEFIFYYLNKLKILFNHIYLFAPPSTLSTHSLYFHLLLHFISL